MRFNELNLFGLYVAPIAVILGITETNVATKLSRLKERLRQNLTQTKE